MRKILTSLSVLALSVGMASAGGKLAVPTEPVVAAPAPMVYDWSGGYAGFGLNYGRASYRVDGDSDDFWPSGSGFGIGGFIGHNWQNGNIVYGLEGHLSGHRMRGSRDFDAGQGVIQTVRTNLRSLASLRGRVGVAQDRTLFFLTAGPAIGSVRHNATFSDESGTLAAWSESRSVSGLMIGAGIEHALAGGWHIRGDLEHYRFRGRDFNTFDSDPGPDFPNVRTRVNLARISAVFRF